MIISGICQNRKTGRDRIEARIDNEINVKAENEITIIVENIEAQNITIAEIHKMLEEVRVKQAIE